MEMARMENAMKRNLARIVLRGREATIIRYALASRYADLFSRPHPHFKDRHALWEFVSKKIITGRPFDYLEFGVWKGESISRIAALNGQPGVRLFGFDSFEGLPFDWMEGWPKGKFSLGGGIPKAADSRIEFIKGWFDETLPQFLAGFRPQEQLWVHMDADLYGSTIAVLAQLNPIIRAGTLIAFDDFQSLTHDFKAFCDFQEMSGKTLELIAATDDCRQAVFLVNSARR